LVLIGQRSTRTGPIADTAVTLASVLQRGQVRTMPGMDHFGPEWHPATVATTIADFLGSPAVDRGRF
jgi:pimeloyl-ACP methyl ester carboxylesterase